MSLHLMKRWHYKKKEHVRQENKANECKFNLKPSIALQVTVSFSAMTRRQQKQFYLISSKTINESMLSITVKLKLSLIKHHFMLKVVARLLIPARLQVTLVKLK